MNSSNTPLETLRSTLAECCTRLNSVEEAFMAINGGLFGYAPVSPEGNAKQAAAPSLEIIAFGLRDRLGILSGDVQKIAARI